MHATIRTWLHKTYGNGIRRRALQRAVRSQDSGGGSIEGPALSRCLVCANSAFSEPWSAAFSGPRLFNLLNPVDSDAAAVRVLMGRKYRRLPCCGTLQGQPFRFATCSHCRKRLGFMGFAVAKAASRGAQMSSGRRNEGLCTCFRTSLFRA